MVYCMNVYVLCTELGAEDSVAQQVLHPQGICSLVGDAEISQIKCGRCHMGGQSKEYIPSLEQSG